MFGRFAAIAARHQGAIKADIPDLALDWKSGGAILNNGHTIQVKAAPGGTLRRGDKRYELVQYHFHAPSEHLVARPVSRPHSRCRSERFAAGVTQILDL